MTVELDADKLIKAMMAPLVDEVVGCCTIDERTARYLATAAYTAMRDVLEPVGWMYQSDIPSVQYRVVRADRREVVHRGWTESQLYALPEIKS